MEGLPEKLQSSLYSCAKLNEIKLMFAENENTEGYDANDVCCSVEKHGGSALVKAAELGHFEVVRWLIEDCGVSATETKCSWERTPLLWAASGGYLEIVQWLINEGHSDPKTERDDSGYTALLLATQSRSLETVQWLIKEGHSDPKTESNNYGRTALLVAATYGCLEIVQWLIKEGGSSPQEVDNERLTPLLHAAAQARGDDHASICRWLLNEGLSSLQEQGNNANGVMYYLAYWARQGGAAVMGWMKSRLSLFSSWSVRDHHQFPRRYRLVCGVALWCMTGGAHRSTAAKRRAHAAKSPHHVTGVVVPVEVVGALFRFWDGDVFAPTTNKLDWL
eukprot:TRINITY_DN68095_c3_g6_i1.p1 TRINITY_DN68095_c3_g6~~TRINITY_DN68095_c3_g6_i1.p1  ORF type:complete len:335 (-),score=22.24 TRINITY_DN68095_c3_g6_i1:184-1188(-)